MAIQLKRRTPDSKTKDIVVPYEEILAEEEAERLQMHLDLESGRITPEEMMRRNCIDLGGYHTFASYNQARGVRRA